jgi:S-adenosyl-L-methionine hydrolase (adenosine-forming)
MGRKDKPPIITLTSDFGLTDAYVATMKAAILRYCSNALLIDVTHQVPPQDVLCGSISLERAIDGFPPGTVHLAVVDPGVGSDRRILIVKLRDSLVVCPDNGLITWAWRRLGPGEASELIWRPAGRISDVFHGRDIMGPVAGMLAEGKSPRAISRPIDDPVLLEIQPASKPAKLGRVIHIDHFGNATTNIPREAFGIVAKPTVKVGRRRVGRVRRTYGDAAPGAALALFGSSGLLEIAVRDGSAAEELGLRAGDRVEIR